MFTRFNEMIYSNETNEIKKICDEMDIHLGPDGEYYSDKIRTSLRGLEIGKKYADIDDDKTYEITYDDKDLGVQTRYVNGKEAVRKILKETGAYDTGYTIFQNVTEEF